MTDDIFEDKFFEIYKRYTTNTRRYFAQKRNRICLQNDLMFETKQSTFSRINLLILTLYT